MYLVANGIRASTKSTYSAAQKSYLEFCEMYGLSPFVSTEQILLTYIAYMSVKKLSHSTMLVYLSAIKSLHVMLGFAVPDTGTPRIKLALKAVLELGQAPAQKQPITYLLLSNMFKMIPDSFDGYMYKSALALGFFAALRSHEYVAPNTGHTSPLLISSISFFFHNDLRCMTVTIPKSKTTTHGFSVSLGCSLTELCAVCTLRYYLKLRYNSTYCDVSQPLFVHSDQTVLTKSVFNNYIRKLAGQLSLNPSLFSAHSLRSGATTSAAAAGFQDWELGTLGNWKSDTYKRYIRNVEIHTLNFSQRLSKHHLG